MSSHINWAVISSISRVSSLFGVALVVLDGVMLVLSTFFSGVPLPLLSAILEGVPIDLSIFLDGVAKFRSRLAGVFVNLSLYLPLCENFSWLSCSTQEKER